MELWGKVCLVTFNDSFDDYPRGDLERCWITHILFKSFENISWINRLRYEIKSVVNVECMFVLCIEYNIFIGLHLSMEKFFGNTDKDNYVISILLYRNEFWTVFPQIKLDATEGCWECYHRGNMWKTTKLKEKKNVVVYERNSWKFWTYEERMMGEFDVQKLYCKQRDREKHQLTCVNKWQHRLEMIIMRHSLLWTFLL